MRQQTQSIEIHGLTESIAFCEAQGLAKCFQAYADHCAGDDIMMIGFNANSGYTFIALESGIQICSMLGRKVEFIVTDFETGEEHFFDSFEDAEDKINEAQ
jgi:hypothetical protein